MNKQSKKELKEQYKNREIIGGVYRVICQGSAKQFLRSTEDIKGSKNRFIFSIATNSCPDMSMLKEWNEFGPNAFDFEILEEIVKKETQTDSEFSEDTHFLFETWKEKLSYDVTKRNKVESK